jgi:hypothetical protein
MFILKDIPFNLVIFVITTLIGYLLLHDATIITSARVLIGYQSFEVFIDVFIEKKGTLFRILIALHQY